MAHSIHMYKLAAAAHMHHKSPALFTFLVSSSAIHNSGRQMSNDTLSHPAPLRPSCVSSPMYSHTHTHTHTSMPYCRTHTCLSIHASGQAIYFCIVVTHIPRSLSQLVYAAYAAPTYTLCLFLRILLKQCIIEH